MFSRIGQIRDKLGGYKIWIIDKSHDYLRVGNDKRKIGSLHKNIKMCDLCLPTNKPKAECKSEIIKQTRTFNQTNRETKDTFGNNEAFNNKRNFNCVHKL